MTGSLAATKRSVLAQEAPAGIADAPGRAFRPRIAIRVVSW
jgi:hypothetical protein